MTFFIMLIIVLLTIVGTGAIILRKKAKNTNVSEFWKLFFAIVLFGISKGLSLAQPTLAIPKIAMFVFACFLTIWFVFSILYKRKNRNYMR